MFTGIVTAIGKIAKLEQRGVDWPLTIQAPATFLRKAGIGDSIAVSGVCLTVVRRTATSFSADVSAETLKATTASAWRAGQTVNLERALALGQELGGHLVTGHVDGVGHLRRRRDAERSSRFEFALPKALARYVARKGSICIDGVSLTVNEAGPTGFGVNMIPHTLGHTTLGRLKTGDAVNLEVDLVARYLERLNAGTS